jgi:hypothetical protein
VQHSLRDDERGVEYELSALEGAEEDQRAWREITEKSGSAVATNPLGLTAERVEEAITEDERIRVLKATTSQARPVATI